MNDRDRILAILDHQPPDRIPWIPRLKPWYQARINTHTMPEKWKDLSLRDLEKTLGAGTPARDGKIYDTVHDNVEIVEFEKDGKRVKEYRTSKGTVRTVKRYSDTLNELGLSGRTEEFLLKGPADYLVWEYVMEHTRWEPRYEDYQAYVEDIGGDGLPILGVGDVPFHEFAEVLTGYEQAFCQLADYPAEVAHLLQVITGVQRERLWPVIANSPARLIQHGSHLSSQITPPPYYREFNSLMHEHGKSVAMHADADTSLILEQIESAGWDMVECFVTSPMVPVTVERAREVWGSRIIIWGGIPSLLFAPTFPEEEFRRQIEELFAAIAPGDAFILGVADNVMPDSVIDRVAWISDYVEKNGDCPLT